LVEKIITLDNVNPVDILGVENKNLNLLSKAFPASKVICRGREIRLIGQRSEIQQINHIIYSLLDHFNVHSKLTEDDVQMYLDTKDKEIKLPNDRVLLHGTKGAPIKARSHNQQQIITEAAQKDLVFAVGPAGTGKTYVAVALAVKALKNKEIKRIIITRPAVEAGERLGFLPGDLTEKVEPYLRPIYDALSDMIPSEKLKFYRENNIVEIAPLAYMRGRTLENAFVLLDEAQNTTTSQMKMFLTRLGQKSKMIITGDISQIDLPGNQKSGMVEALERLKHIDDIGKIYLTEEDVVRHRLVKKIIQAYK